MLSIGKQRTAISTDPDKVLFCLQIVEIFLISP